MDQDLEQDYQNLLPEDGLNEISDYADQVVASSGREALQGLMGHQPMSMSYMGQNSSISDLTAQNSYPQPYLVAPSPADAIQDIGLSPVQRSMGYPEVDRAYNVGYDNGLLSGSARQDAWNALHLAGVPQISMPDASQAVTKRRRINGSDDGTGTIHHSEIAYSEVGSQEYTEQRLSDSAYGTKSVTTESIVEPYSRLAIPSSHGTHTRPPNSVSLSDFDVERDEQSHEQLSQSGSEVVPSQESTRLKCGLEGCNWTGKNYSDKTKHEKRHLKQYKCEKEGCRRAKEGFGTINDLDRHRRSVHGFKPKNGEPGKSYKCFAEGCPKRNREWPRQDNFRQHLRRMHGDSNVDELMRKSEKWYDNIKWLRREPPTTPTSQSQPGPSQALVASNFQPPNPLSSDPSSGPWAQENIRERTSGDSVMPTELTKGATTPSRASESTPFGSPVPSLTRGAAHLNIENSPVSDIRGRQGDPPNSRLDVSLRHRRCSSTNSPRSQPNSQVYSVLSPITSDSYDDTVTRTAIDLIQGLTDRLAEWDDRRRIRDEMHSPGRSDAAGETVSMRDHIQQNRHELKMFLLDGLRRLGVQPGDLDYSRPRISDDRSDVGHTEQQRKYECPVCKKKVDSQSKLTKHKRRHDRPYHCTFPDCDRSFGSKNDWKRHENSQHFRLQSWRCHIKSKIHPFAECNRLFYRREKFISHLNRAHDKTDEKEIATFLKTDEIGRNGQSRFWCGFCREILPLRHRGIDAWNERFSHIDDQHFRLGHKIDQWQHPEIHDSDSPVTDVYDSDRNEDAPNADQLVQDDDGDSSDTDSDSEPTQDADPSSAQITQKGGVLPLIRINADQTNNNDSSPEHQERSPRPHLRVDTTLQHSIPPQTQKRKFTPGPGAPFASTQPRNSYPRQSDPNQAMIPRSADNASSNPNRIASRAFSRSRSRATTAAALFSTTYPAIQGPNPNPDNVYSCCHCSGQTMEKGHCSGQMVEKSLIFEAVTNQCLTCQHVVCDHCPLVKSS